MSTQLERFQAIVAAAAADYAAGTLTEATPALLASLTEAPVQSNGLPAGVGVIDSANGLVSADPAVFNNPQLAGWMFCVKPAEVLFNKDSQAAWTINENTTNAARADSGLGFYSSVWPMVDTGNPSHPWQPAPLVGPFNNEVPWVPHATSFGGEFDTWAKVIERFKAFKQPSFNPNQFGPAA